MKKIFPILFLLSCWLATSAAQDTTAKNSLDTAVNPITVDKVHHSDSIVQSQNGIEFHPNKVDCEEGLPDDRFWKQLDKALEPNMAATLAGLSLAALALLLSALSSQEAKLAQMSLHQFPEENMAAQRQEIANYKLAIYYIKCSFFWFIAFLIETLTIDILQDSENFLVNWVPEGEAIEVLLSAGILAVGLTFLVKGAQKMGNWQSK